MLFSYLITAINTYTFIYFIYFLKDKHRPQPQVQQEKRGSSGLHKKGNVYFIMMPMV